MHEKSKEKDPKIENVCDVILDNNKPGNFHFIFRHTHQKQKKRKKEKLAFNKNYSRKLRFSWERRRPPFFFSILNFFTQNVNFSPAKKMLLRKIRIFWRREFFFLSFRIFFLRNENKPIFFLRKSLHVPHNFLEKKDEARRKIVKNCVYFVY